MRPSCGSPRATLVALYTILIALLLSVTSDVNHAQTTSTLPKSWNDAVAKLGDEVAAAESPATVMLSVNNISSLDASYAGAVESALREQLQRHSFSFAPENTLAAQSAIRLQLSLSESAAEYVWVIQILSDHSDGTAVPVMIVAAPKTDLADAVPEAESLSLEKRFVWKQPGKFLDFALLKDPISGELTLLVLGTNRLTTYKLANSQWQASRTSPIPQATPSTRDPQGTIELKEGRLSLKGIECVGGQDLAGVLECKSVKTPRILRGPFVAIAGHPISLGAVVAEKCRGELISLYTAESDWTQGDWIRGYLSKGIPSPLVPSGNTLEFNGPVMALRSEPEGISARAIIHDLKAGEYGAYIVTATCSN
jgi:hypothetical protein